MAYPAEVPAAIDVGGLVSPDCRKIAFKDAIFFSPGTQLAIISTHRVIRLGAKSAVNTVSGSHRFYSSLVDLWWTYSISLT